MTIDRAATAWTPHPGGPLRYRANSRFGADGLPPGAWFGRVSAAIEAPDGSVVVFQRGPAIDPIVFLDRDGTYLRSWDLGFDLPHGMRLMPDGTLWLTDAGRHRVLKTTLDGEILMELGTADVAGTDERTFNKPTDVAVAADGTIYVSDGYGNCRVVTFDPDGTYRGTWGVPARRPASSTRRIPWRSPRTGRSGSATAATCGSSGSSPTAATSTRGPTSARPSASSSTRTSCGSSATARSASCSAGTASAAG